MTTIIRLNKVDITPQERTRMYGYIDRNEEFLGIHDRIYARGICLGNDIGIISMDLIAINPVWQHAVDENGKGHTVLTATHNHAGPAICHPILNWWDSCSSSEINYVNQIKDKIKNMFLGGYIYSLKTDEVFIGYKEISDICSGRALRRYAVQTVIFASRINGKLVPILISLPCHSTVLGPDNRYISGDLAGYVAGKLEDRYNTVVPIINGAGGDISTRYTRVSRDFDEVARLGSSLSEKMINVIDNEDFSLKISLNDVKYIEKIVEVSIDKRRISETINKDKSSKDESIVVLRRIVNKLPARIYARLGLISFRNFALLFIPFEPTMAIQGMLNDEIKDRKIVVVGYSYDYFGYLATDPDTYEYNMTLVDTNKMLNILKNLLLIGH